MQISSLPPLPSATSDEVELQFSDIPPIDPPIEIRPLQPQTIEPHSTNQLLSDVFIEALSQFPKPSAPALNPNIDNPNSRSPSSKNANYSKSNSLSNPYVNNQFIPASSSKVVQDEEPLELIEEPIEILESSSIETEALPLNDEKQEETELTDEAPGPIEDWQQPEPLIREQEAPESLPQWEAPQTMVIVPETNGWVDPVARTLPPVNSMVQRPGETLTWWKTEVTKPLDMSRQAEQIDSQGLVYQALQNSPRIQAVSQNPLIRELQIVEADSEFDAVQYIRSQFEDRVDPVGNSLTVGNGESFLKDNIWSADLGLRRKARTGATVELNQRLGFQNSNSNFFVPQDQGTATLALNVTQPLLRGRGRYYNQSQILIAQATNGAAWQTFNAELQEELLGVVSAYWDLYLTRSIYLQKRRNVERGSVILRRLEGRAGLDSLPSQIARARSSVQTRKTELANALRDVRNAETEVRRRIADTRWIGGVATELIPGEIPTANTFQIPLEQVVYSALQHRPEVHEAMSRVRIASVQRDVSANELLPELSLLMGTYVSALRGDTGILNAFQDQFGQVKPGYSFGVNFELPYGNRAARSRLAQRELQVKKIKYEFDEVMQTVIAESQVAIRRVESASETLVAATEAIRAAHTDRNQFERRWESFALVEGDLTEGQNPTTVLDQLLDSQDRLASAELVYVQAERELKVAEVALQRAMGTLLMTQSVSANRTINGDVPQMNILKDGSPIYSGSAEAIPVQVPGEFDASQAVFSGVSQ